MPSKDISNFQDDRVLEINIWHTICKVYSAKRVLITIFDFYLFSQKFIVFVWFLSSIISIQLTVANPEL